MKHAITALLRAKGFHCTEQVFCFDGTSNRYVDILAFEPNSTKAYIIDPTVRFESNEDQDAAVQADKETIYSKCYADLSSKYPQFGRRQFETIGLWFGARGVIGRGVSAFWTRFALEPRQLAEIAEKVLLASMAMVHQHIYSRSSA